MNEKLNRLYQKVCDYSPDDSSSEFSFTERLAKENSWTPEFAQRVVEEYKKFMFLAVAAGHPVTPSEQVDQAWHLHLIYTRSYWTGLCEKVLEKQVHHGPTKGGHKEETKYRDWYERTKQSYARLFGENPPDDIWPNAQIRFGDDLYFRRVNTRRHWVVPKKTFQRAAFAVLLIIGVASLLVFAGHFAQSIRSYANDPQRNDATPLTNAIYIPDKAGSIGHRSAQTVQRTYPIRDLKPVRWDRQESGREKKHKQESSNFFFVIVFVCIVTSLVLYGMIVGNRCPSCGEWRALERTGNEREDHGLIKPKTEEECKCKLCGYTKWSAKASNDGGCGGCGGCGCGCGCGG